jgi:hypothetical protein
MASEQAEPSSTVASNRFGLGSSGCYQFRYQRKIYLFRLLTLGTSARADGRRAGDRRSVDRR